MSKLWNVMNDLEMVTSKIVSAREIIDSAIDRIQEHQYDKAEMMMSAAYEFLEYYLAEFDEKFKLAWNETVIKQKQEEQKSWVLPVDEDGVVTFPDELIEKTGWKEGDVLEWSSNYDGSYTLKKVEE